jgi:tetratricopeptide (TPR) repeat protein
MASKKRSPLNRPLEDDNLSPSVDLVAENRETFDFLRAFLSMSKGFKVAVAEINFPPDTDALIAALREHPDCQGIQFVVLKLDDRDLRFLLETVKKDLGMTVIEPDKKLVILIRGLEQSIGTSGDSPPLLTNLNYARDNFPLSLPYPTLLILPDYAVTRLARFAPDFWSWTSATFRFQTCRETRNLAINRAFDHIAGPDLNRTYPKSERTERIELLERLLQEYPDDTGASIRTRIEILNQLGEEYRSIREFESAKEYFQQSLELNQEISDRYGAAISYNNLGNAYTLSEQYQEAIDFYQRSLEIFQKIGDRYEEATSYNNLGNAYYSSGRYGEAIKFYQRSLEIKREIGSRSGEANSYNNLGNAYYSSEQYQEAIDFYQRSLDIYREIGDRYKEAKAYNNLGNAYYSSGRYGEAIEFFQRSLEIFQEIGDRSGVADSYNNLGNAYSLSGQYGEAIEFYQRSLEIFQKIGDRSEEAKTWFNLGSTFQTLDRKSEAKDAYLRSRELFQAMGLDADVQKCDRAIHPSL